VNYYQKTEYLALSGFYLCLKDKTTALRALLINTAAVTFTCHKMALFCI